MFSLKCFILYAILFISTIAIAQSDKAIALEQEIYAHNNQAEYTKSQELIHQFLQRTDISDEDRYNAYIYNSNIFKRLFDYPSVLKNLDNALEFGIKTENKPSCINNILCQKALAHFDIHNYSISDSLMRILAIEDYQYLNDEYQSKIFMQEGYLLYLKKDYLNADKRFDVAIEKMKTSSPCDLPMIYGKKIELYGAINNRENLQQTYRKSLLSAESCGILKYTMYTTQMMMKAYELMNDYKEAYHCALLLDSIQEVYNSESHLQLITELETKYEVTHKDQQIYEAKVKANSQSTKIYLLVLSVLLVLLVSIVYILQSRQKTLLKSKQMNLAYTHQLFENIEQERKRISSDLHDSVGHDLLSIKEGLKMQNPFVEEKISKILEEIRVITRNLQPILFEKIGLVLSIENLLERIQLHSSIIINHDHEYGNELNKSDELQVYRIVQEALSNALKYSNAFTLKINIFRKANTIIVQIFDNGDGFNVNKTLASKNAFGLHSIIQRAVAIGAKATITSKKSRTLIEIKIPINI